MIDTGVKGRIALVTGANHGIGAAIAKALAAQGAKVFVTYFRGGTAYSEAKLEDARTAGVGGDRLYRAQQQQTAEHVLSSIRASGGVGSMLELDLADLESIRVAFDSCERELGPVEILINNHAYCALETFDPANVGVTASEGAVTMTSAQGIDLRFAVNVRATVLLMTEFVRRHIGRPPGDASSISAPMQRIVMTGTSAMRRASMRSSPTAVRPPRSWGSMVLRSTS